MLFEMDPNDNAQRVVCWFVYVVRFYKQHNVNKKTTKTCGISVIVGCVGFVLSWLCVYVGAVLWF